MTVATHAHPHGSCIMGVDPGVSGAIAFYWWSAPDRIAVEDVPTAGGEIDAATLAKRILIMAPCAAFVEKVHSMPKQGVASSFKFGAAYGTVLGTLAALEIPVHLVSPQLWKKHFRIPADKEKARGLALQLFPACSEHFKRKMDHGRAEAALLALYGSKQEAA